MHSRSSISRCGSWQSPARLVPSARAYGSLLQAATRRALFRRGAPGPDTPAADPADSAQVTVRRQRLEAVLFLSREALGLRKLAQSANLADATEARTLLGELRRCLDARGSAFQVEQLAGGYQLRTRPKFAAWL